jgi:hypothetical protein
LNGFAIIGNTLLLLFFVLCEKEKVVSRKKEFVIKVGIYFARLFSNNRMRYFCWLLEREKCSIARLVHLHLRCVPKCHSAILYHDAESCKNEVFLWTVGKSFFNVVIKKMIEHGEAFIEPFKPDHHFLF